jgi:hypothetical protein
MNAWQRTEFMSMTDDEAVERHKFDIAEGSLYPGATLKNADGVFPADRMLAMSSASMAG